MKNPAYYKERWPLLFNLAMIVAIILILAVAAHLVDRCFDLGTECERVADNLLIAGLIKVEHVSSFPSCRCTLGVCDIVT